MPGTKQHIGMIGLGVMGRNFLLNLADHGFSAAGYDKDAEKVKALREEGKEKAVKGAESVEEFLGLLERPRAVMLLVPAGKIVDSVIEELVPRLEEGDLIIDGGNSRFTDTGRRAKALDGKKLGFLGVGISGGEKGARFGPSMMPGGPEAVYERVRPAFEAASAKVDGEPCVTWLGPGSAGHYVKMVHNGIEYGLIQLLAETYDLMKRGLGLDNDALHRIYADWNESETAGFLVEITADIFRKDDDRTGKRLIDVIKDQAKQKGTGKWTSQDAMDLQVPVPTIDAAVAWRDLSGFKEERVRAAETMHGPDVTFDGDRKGFLARLHEAVFAAMIATYAQGLAQLRIASDRYEYGLDLEAVARIWRGGCIIRAALLEDIRSAFKRRPDLPNLLLDPRFQEELARRTAGLREVVRTAAAIGIPVPALMSSLAYVDGYRSAWSPANLIQAQRDYFGSHTYERVDAEGTFHTIWQED
jgi:6-phosphogluconate dehydrogenase